MAKEVYFVKSLEEDFATKTLEGTNKVSFQTIQDMVKTKTIKPNTKSFGRKRRLSCTILDKNYTKTYRPQGIIFQTKQKPDYIMPFDLVLLSATDRIIVHYYRIKNNLHIYYNHTLIPGFEKFILKDFQSLIKRYASPKVVWDEINEFRKENGFNSLPPQKFRLVEYNEAVYHKNVKIKPVAVFGYRKEAREIAKKLHLPHFVSAKEFYNTLEREEEKDKTLLVIGRFQPMHLGHLALIKRYSDAGFFVKLAIGSSQKSFELHNPLTSKEREEKVRKAFEDFGINKYKIYHVPDILSGDYVKHVLKIVGQFDTIATGNPSVLKLFIKYKSKRPWSIESFDEGSGRPGGKITSGMIRKRWLTGQNLKGGLSKSTHQYLKSIGFSERLKKINSKK